MDGIVGGEGFVSPFPPEEVGEPNWDEKEEGLPSVRDEEGSVEPGTKIQINRIRIVREGGVRGS